MSGPASRDGEKRQGQSTGTLRYVVRTFDAITHEEVGNWGWDVVTDTIYFSPELRRLLGYAEADFGATVDGGIGTYILAEERERVSAEFAAAAEHGSPFEITATLVRPDGARLRLTVRGKPVYAVPAEPMGPPEGPRYRRDDWRTRPAPAPAPAPPAPGSAAGTLCYVMRTFDAVSLRELGRWGWNVASGAMFLSPEISSVIGYVEDDFGGTLDAGFDLFLDPDDRARIGRGFLTAAESAAPIVLDGTVIRSDGVKIRLLSRGQPVFPTVGNRESLLLGDVGQPSAERRLAYIVAESPILITTLDLSLRYVHVNSPVTAYTGLAPEMMVGRRPSELFKPAGAHVEAMAAESLRTGETIRGDVKIVRGDRLRVLEMTVFPLRDEYGVAAEVCCMSTDVTDARAQEEGARARHAATDLIVSALSENRLVAMRQPVIDIHGEETVSDELLVRLSLRDGTLLQPAAFLPDAERFGLVQKIDLWMLDQALEIADVRPAQVNLSAITVSDRGARDAIVTALRSSLQVAPRVIFEITETAAMDHLDAACDFAEQLAALGCGLALDDFGTGFGSFTYLRRLPLRYLKIDQSFVTGLAASEPDRRVVSSIIGIARQFELRTIAEGVEDAETLTTLGDLGADYAQGFYLGRPA